MGTPAAVILGCDGPRLTAEERDFFAEAQPWGFILFGRNVQRPEQVKRLTGALRDAVGREAPVLIDQEGGRVQRMGPPHWRQWLPPMDQMARAGARAMYLRYRLIAAELIEVGINVNCAPCCDVALPDTHPILRNRCFGTDPARVVEGARAAAEGLMAGGVLPVMKHMPGHGRALVDSHLSLPVVTEDQSTLRAVDFAPFKALADLPMGMTGHIRFTALDPENPATTSRALVAIIRDEIGFSGLLMSDDISMEALSGTVAERTRAARDAGCDLVLHCNGRLAEMAEVVAAAGALTGLALVRAQTALVARCRPQSLDMAGAEAELRDLLDGTVNG